MNLFFIVKINFKKGINFQKIKILPINFLKTIFRIAIQNINTYLFLYKALNCRISQCFYPRTLYLIIRNQFLCSTRKKSAY